MDRDVFILSAATAVEPADAIHLALENIDINPSRVQDAIFSSNDSTSVPNIEHIVNKAGLTCPAVLVGSSGLRAIFFASQSILSGDLDMVLVALGENASTALLLVSPDAVGRYNLMPRARLAARSLAGTDSALRAAGIASDDIAVSRTGESGTLSIKELVEELEQHQAQWGMVSADSFALLVERI